MSPIWLVPSALAALHIPRISFRQIEASKSENKGEFILDYLEHSQLEIAIYFTFIMRAS